MSTAFMVLKLSWISIFTMLWLAIFRLIPINGSYVGFVGIFLILAFLSAAQEESKKGKSDGPRSDNV